MSYRSRRHLFIQEWTIWFVRSIPSNTAKMLEMDLNVGVGTDGPASNNDLDMFEETRLAALLAKTHSNDPTVIPARQAMEMATIRGARAVHMGDVTGSLEPGKQADMAIVDMDGIHNQPHFQNANDAVYSRIVYAAKSGDVAHVMCNGRWLMRDRELLTIDEAAAKATGAQVAAEIDAFVLKRESSPYHKLVLLAGVQRQESFEIQVKVPIVDNKQVLEVLNSDQVEITKSSHYKQYDNYFIFDGVDPDASRLRYREDEYVNKNGDIYQSRTRLTLLGQGERLEYSNAVMLSRSRFLAQADRTLRFYREYFAPAAEVEVHKDRLRWRIIYKETDFAVNLDKLMQPDTPGYYLEIKSRTWSRTDAERKASLIGELMELFGADLNAAETGDYSDIAQKTI